MIINSKPREDYRIAKKLLFEFWMPSDAIKLERARNFRQFTEEEFLFIFSTNIASRGFSDGYEMVRLNNVAAMRFFRDICSMPQVLAEKKFFVADDEDKAYSIKFTLSGTQLHFEDEISGMFFETPVEEFCNAAAKSFCRLCDYLIELFPELSDIDGFLQMKASISTTFENWKFV